MPKNTGTTWHHGQKTQDDQPLPFPDDQFDVGAFVYFAKIIEWEFPGFTVAAAWDELLRMQQEIEHNGWIQGTEHRFMIIARNRKT